MKFNSKLISFVFGCVFLFASSWQSTYALDYESISDDELRAAYLTSIMRYVSWPDDENKPHFVIGILESAAIFQVLDQSPLPSIRNRPIQVRQIQRTTQINDLDVLYVGPRAVSQLSSIASQAKNNHILIVSEGASARDDIMLNLVPSRQNRISFQVNTDRIHEAGLNTSNDLILLGGAELEMAVAYRRKIAEVAALNEAYQSTQDELAEAMLGNRQLNERIHMLEAAIEERDSVLQAQAGSLEDKQTLMDSQERTLNKLLAELDEQRLKLYQRENQLNTIQQLLNRSQQHLESQQNELDIKEAQLQEKQQESIALAERIAVNRSTLATQQQVLREQREAISEQAHLLERREQTINKQRDILLYIGIGLLIALFFALLSILLYYNKRKTAAQLMKTLEELEDAQDKLVEAEKMAALGNLVAGVAHEVNTPLGVALTATTMLEDRRDSLALSTQENRLTKDQLDKFLEISSESLKLTERNLTRVAQLISNFKQVAVDQMVTERREINLAEYLEEIMSTLSIELRRVGIQYEITSEEKLSMQTIPGALAQIVTNLTTNAIRHAFPDRQDGNIFIHIKELNAYSLEIKFCDNGIGMQKDVVSKLYDPFFTTKRNAGGTGLGMSIIYNLVRQTLHGELEVRSVLNEGTCYFIHIPKVTPKYED